MRIIGGVWRGRRLIAPEGNATRPTADRLRQALFDMLLHADWGGAETLRGAAVLDGFAGTGALGLEALSRGAESATFVERDRAALAALSRNIAACNAAARSTVIGADLLTITAGPAFDLVFLDPPYGERLVWRALTALAGRRRLRPGTLVMAETARGEPVGTEMTVLADRAYGAGRVLVMRVPDHAAAETVAQA